MFTIPLISYTYVGLVKRVAQGLSIEDGEEMARGLYCIRPHERFRTHLFGSAWLCYCVMLAWFWVPMYQQIILEQQSDAQRIYDYELALQAGVRALNVWNFSQRNVGIAYAFARRTVPAITYPVEDVWNWRGAAVAGLLLAASLYGSWHGWHEGSLLHATFVPFYMNAAASGASDLNAGSTTAAPTHTYGGGTFVRATNTYTVASGNPSTDGFVSAGDYVSVYTTTGRTVATFVMIVDSTTATTIIGSATGVVYGVNTTVSETANASSLTIGGSWATLLPLGATASAGGLGTFTIPQSTKINIKQASYSLSAALTIAMAGATTTPLWFSGYNTNPGDLDADTTNALTKPSFSVGGNLLTTSGAHSIWSGVSVNGSRVGTVWTGSATGVMISRCRSTNINSNAAAIAFTAGGVGTCAYSWFTAPSSATTTGTISCSNTTFIGVVADTGGLAGFNLGTNTYTLMQCIGLTNTGSGFLGSTAVVRAFGCTVYGATTDGFKWTGTPGAQCVIAGCLVSGLNGSTATTNGFDNASGVNTNNVILSCNDVYNVTNRTVGLGDSPEWFPQTDSNPVVTSVTDMTPVASSNAINNGFPGIYENETFSSFPPIGAVTPRPGGGGVAIFGG